jgi:hypothetical protein
MTRDQVIEQLRGIDSKNVAGLDSMAHIMVEQGRVPARAAVALIGGPDASMSQKAGYLLGHMDDLAIVPLLEAPEPKDVFDRLWAMETLVSAQLDLRKRIVSRLDAMLADKTNVPWRTNQVVEEKVQPSRVCDEAYLLMRRLLNTNEDRNQHMYDRRAFLRLPEKDRDAEITKARKSRTWTNLTGSED